MPGIALAIPRREHIVVDFIYASRKPRTQAKLSILFDTTKRLMLGLFLFRSVGQVGFLVTGNELLLAFFPNFLEPLFLVTVTILAFERVIRHYPDWQERGFAILYRYRWLIGTVIVIYKLQDEWVTHVGNIDRTEFLEQLFGG